MLVTLQHNYASLSLQHDTLSLAQNHVAGLLPEYSEMMEEVHEGFKEFCLTKEARFLGKNREKFDPTKEPESNTTCLLCYKEFKDNKALRNHQASPLHHNIKAKAHTLGRQNCETCSQFKRTDGELYGDKKTKDRQHKRKCRNMLEDCLTCPFCLEAPIHW